MLTNKKAAQAAVTPSVAPRTAPIPATTAAPKPMLFKTAKLPTVGRPAAPATLGTDMGTDEPAVTELGESAPEMTGAEPSIEAASMGTESTIGTSDMVDENPVQEHQPDAGIGGDEPPDDPPSALSRRPAPRPNPPVMGSFVIKGSKDKGMIKPTRGSKVPPQAVDGSGDRLYRCKPTGKCVEITPEDILPPEPPARQRKPKKPRR
jgi:hypothetical protein